MTLADPASRRDKPAKPRGSKVLAILGVLLLVVGIVTGQQGTHRVTGAARDIANSGDEIRNSLLVEVAVPGQGEVDLDPGRYDVFAISPEGTGFQRTTTSTVPGPTDRTEPDDLYPGYDEPTVEVTDPGGSKVRLRSPGIESMFSAANGELYPIRTFTVREPGTYRVTVTGSGAAKVGVGPTVDNGYFGRLVRSGILTFLGYVGAGLGFVLAAAGLIWFLVAGDGRQPVATAGWPPPGGWGPPRGPGPWGAPPPGAWGGPPPGPWGAPPPGAWGPAPTGGPPGWVPPPVRPAPPRAAAPPPPPPPAPGPSSPSSPSSGSVGGPDPGSDPTTADAAPHAPTFVAPPATPWGQAPSPLPTAPAWPPRPSPGGDPDPSG